jgi:hypothetical protein
MEDKIQIKIKEYGKIDIINFYNNINHCLKIMLIFKVNKM